ncbi:GYF domain-containing protein [Luteolibacter marinus]|uniref:GYF domain-containing protein n=1 Tax=Luteolibacter marinus TaxID=2776705 RepID=UPI001868F1C4|nr:GYF domain-containing protein [Luteolibacter marinus]
MEQWYYGSEAGQHGPVDEDELRAMILSGGVGARTLVWREGMVDWRPIQSVPELSGQLSPYAAPSSAVPGYYPPAGIPSSGLAVASLVCGILSMVTFCMYGGIIGIPAVICGHLALSQIKSSAVPMAGRGMAIAGLVTGYLGLLVLASMITIILIVYLQSVHQSP